MIQLEIIVPVAIACFAGLMWLLRPRHRTQNTDLSKLQLKLAGYIPRHYRHFPQVRQALSATDARYLRDRASPAVAQRVLQERRAIALQFLSGLREDFANLDRLARMVAALSPAVSHEQETARFLLGLKFQVLYFWVRLRLSAGPAPLEQIGELTSLVGILATRMDQAMSAVAALSTPELNSTLSA
jgi:hypothetical protein